MKKITCLVLGLVFGFSISAFAASTNTYILHDAGTIKQLRITITCDTTPGTPTITKIPYNFRGYILTSVETYYGSTAFTDNSDLYILQHSTTGKDILNGAGVDKLDNATNNTFKPYIGGNEAFALVVGDLYTTFANNAVNSSSVEVVLNFLKAN
jgi:hypothetical protein